MLAEHLITKIRKQLVLLLEDSDLKRYGIHNENVQDR